MAVEAVLARVVDRDADRVLTDADFEHIIIAATQGRYGVIRKVDEGDRRTGGRD